MILSQYIIIGGKVISDGEFNSFSDYWYLSVGSEMIWTFFLSVLTLNLSPIGKSIFTILRRFWDRGCKRRLTDCEEK